MWDGPALLHIDTLNQQEKVPERVQERVRKLEADFEELKRKFETQHLELSLRVMTMRESSGLGYS